MQKCELNSDIFLRFRFDCQQRFVFKVQKELEKVSPDFNDYDNVKVS